MLAIRFAHNVTMICFILIEWEIVNRNILYLKKPLNCRNLLSIICLMNANIKWLMVLILMVFVVACGVRQYDMYGFISFRVQHVD